LSIGTAKPGKEELEQIPHHFIDHISIHEPYSAGQYEEEVISFLDAYFREKQVALLVGGTNFYIKAVTQGLDKFPPIPPSIKSTLSAIWASEPGQLLSELREKDPVTYAEIDLKNSRRILRALEVIRASGQPFSAFKKMKNADRPFDIVYLLLERNRADLYQRINQRVLNMIQKGLEAEAKALYAFRQKPPLQTVGYQEWWPFFEGQINRNHVIEKIQQHSRNYAKRQLSWFRKESFWKRFDAADPQSLIHYLSTHPKIKAIL